MALLVPHLWVIVGCMFAGKTEELIRLLRRFRIKKMAVQVFKPIIDDRYAIGAVASHNGAEYEATPINGPREVFALLMPGTRVVAFDEVQFFDPCIVEVCETLISMGLLVIVAGLSLDFRAEPFGSMPDLLARADHLIQVKAICACDGCEEDATRTQRLVNGRPAKSTDPIILVGADESYEARCRKHHEVPK